MQSQSSVDIFALQKKFGPHELPSVLEAVRGKYPNAEILIKGKHGNKVDQRIVIFQDGKFAYCGNRTITLDNFVNLIHNKINTDWIDRIFESSQANGEPDLTLKQFCDRLLQMRVISKADLTKTLLSAYLLSLEVFWVGAGEVIINPKSPHSPPISVEWRIFKAALDKRQSIWKKFGALKNGIHSIPVLTEVGLNAFQADFDEESPEGKLRQFIEHVIDGHSTIVELAKQKKVDPLSLAQRLVNGIEQGWIEITDRVDSTETRRASILVIDDNPTTRKLLVTILQEFYDTHAATGTFSSIGLIPSKKIDLVIVSHSVPVATGLQLCRIIRQNPNYQKMPVIFISSQENFFDRFKTKMAGVTDYITPPLDRTQILYTLDLHLR